MADAARIRRTQSDINITLGAAGSATAITKIPRNGRTYHVISVTTDAKVKIGLNQEPGPFLYRGVGGSLYFDEPDYDEIILENTDAVPQTVVMKTGFGEIKDSRFNFVGGYMPVSYYPAGTIAPQAVNTIPTANHLDVAADATVRMWLIYNDSASATVWLRDQSGTTLIGEPIGPKEKLKVTFNGAFRIRNNSGGNVDVYLTKFQ